MTFCSLMGEVSEWKLPKKCGSFPATHAAWLDIRGPKNEKQIFRLINHLLHVCSILLWVLAQRSELESLFRSVS